MSLPSRSQSPPIVLVTGGTGAIGSEIVRVLCALAASDHASDENPSSDNASRKTEEHKPWRVVANYARDEGRARRLQQETGCELFRADIGEEEQVETLFRALALELAPEAAQTFAQSHLTRASTATSAIENSASETEAEAGSASENAVLDAVSNPADSTPGGARNADSIQGASTVHETNAARETNAASDATGERAESRLYAVVHAAGVSSDALLVRQTASSWRESLRVNADGSFLVARAALQALEDGGRLILLASRAGENGAAGQGAYAASKAATLALMRSAACEGAARGIAVNAICPGFVPSVLSDSLSQKRLAQARNRSVFNRFGAPREVASTVQWLLGPDAAAISSQVIHCDSRTATIVPVEATREP